MPEKFRRNKIVENHIHLWVGDVLFDLGHEGATINCLIPSYDSNLSAAYYGTHIVVNVGLSFCEAKGMSASSSGIWSKLKKPIASELTKRTRVSSRITAI